jgi:hypothetical protein
MKAGREKPCKSRQDIPPSSIVVKLPKEEIQEVELKEEHLCS